jgi:hypothetical protein
VRGRVGVELITYKTCKSWTCHTPAWKSQILPVLINPKTGGLKDYKFEGDSLLVTNKGSK